MFQLIVLNVIHQKCQNSCVGALVTYSLVRDMDNSPGSHRGNGRASRSLPREPQPRGVHGCRHVGLPRPAGTWGLGKAGDAPGHPSLPSTFSSTTPQACFEAFWPGRAGSRCWGEQKDHGCFPALRPTPSSRYPAEKGRTPPSLFCPELARGQLGSRATILIHPGSVAATAAGAFLMELIHQTSD